MASIVSVIKKISNFLTHELWGLRIDKLNSKQGFLLKQIRIFSLSLKGFNEDKCLIKSTALTYYTLFSIVPIIALAFAIANGFGFQESLKANLLEKFNEQQAILIQAFDYANKLLHTTKGGVIAGFGVILLLYSVMKLLGNIEDSFNEIWEIKKGRSIVRKITDYLSILLIAPIFMIVSEGLMVLINTSVGQVVSQSQVFSPVGIVIMKSLAYLLMWALFVFIYMVLPNTKVTFKAAATAGLITTILFKLLQWAYVSFQIYTVQYNAVYGSFAALPLFLIWLQYSWFVVLFGAELAFAYQNVDQYELDYEISNISDRYKRVIALMIANTVVKNFHEGKTALTAGQIAAKLDLPVKLARSIINEFIDTGVFSEVNMAHEKEIGYQPGITDSKMTVKFVIDKLDERGINHLPIDNSVEMENINRLMKDLDDVLNTTKGNMLVKDIV